MKSPLKLLTVSGAVVLSLLVAGCSTSFESTNESPIAGDVGAVSGSVYGGRQPIAGAHVYLLQPSTTTYGGAGIAPASGNASTSLLKSYSSGKFPTSFDGTNYYVTTDANGSFALSDNGIVEYNACTAGAPVYIYSVQGNTGANSNNTAAGLMAVVGICGSFGTSTKVNINEVSTIAAAYAMAGFATDALHVGTSGSALALTGIANAFSNAKQMFDTTSNPYNSPNTAARSTTPGTVSGATGTVPNQEINTLANILSACVNTVGPGSSQCNTLFTSVKSAGSSGTQASDTATAAIYIAHNPTIVTPIYNIVGTSASPYSPALGAAPADFTISLNFTGGGLLTAGAAPRELAVDASGNIWAVTGSSNVLSEFTPLGVPVTANGFTNAALDAPEAVAVDNGGVAAQIYVANSPSTTGMVSRFNALTGAYVSSYAINGGTTPQPLDIAIDGSGNIWTSNYNDNSVSKHGSTGTGTASEYSLVPNPVSISIEPGPSGDVYVSEYNDGNAQKINNASPGSTASIANPTVQGSNASAIDSAGNIWFANYQYVSKLTTGGTFTNYSMGFNNGSVAIDGGNNVWVAEADDGTGTGTVYELNNGGAALSPAAGFVPLPAGVPASIVLDGSGDVWYDMNSDATLREVIGAAVPVATPLAYGVTSSKLGTRP